MSTISKILKYFSFYKSFIGIRIYLIFILVVISSLMEGVGIMMLSPLLNNYFGGQSTTFWLNDYLEYIFDTFSIEMNAINIMIISSSMIFLKGIITFIALSYSAYLRGQFYYLLKNKIIIGFKNLKYSYYLENSIGHLSNIVNEQANRTAGNFTSLINIPVSTVIALTYLFLAFLTSLNFGLLVVTSGFTLFLLFKRVSKYLQDRSTEIVKLNSDIGDLFIDFLNAYKYLSATAQTHKHVTELDKCASKAPRLFFKMGIAGAFIHAMREPLALMFILCLAWMQISIFDEAPAIILLSIFLFYRSLNALIAIQVNIQSTFETAGSVDIVSAEISRIGKEQQVNSSKRRLDFTSNISLDNLVFKYPETKVPAIQSVNIRIQSGQSIAIVGPSGAGKTSLVDLLCALYNPSSGKISVDGVSLRSTDFNFWRSKIGYVPQDPPIFRNSVLGNIVMEFSELNSSDAEFQRAIGAAKLADIDAFVQSLPDGYNTFVGEGGRSLSGGQRQRLAIARELYKNPKLLILDEATSALDAESEASIQQTINRLKNEVTIIIIAHRLVTIKNVDWIYVMENGMIVEQGSFRNLNDVTGSKLAELIKLQAL